ncbi:CoA-binding protein [Mangrovimonas yunxiaonensis]|uniref:CoA-binding protein n=1 Tax=Mangrovimonas yunxiaonensis TaxID=1197477 RepID=A0A084TIZ6_9FLAO|nr:CoA-binding protein [Mangrovimonas yunxiaonensis]KFB00682.1 CoA-binding protein [Mangrovimonas yunxiaonensis]MBR9758271.1 CoA-binding protein [Algicola sp.]GGH46372.1 CoA-binding protein [Mangrovimonas yunxiaonensis]
MNKKTLVFGASLNPNRYAYIAINKLVENGIEVEAFGLEKGTVSGVEIQTALLPYTDLHTITLYVNPTNQKGYYNAIVSLKPKRVIFNPGTENPEFYDILKQHDIYFEAACTLVLLATNQY